MPTTETDAERSEKARALYAAGRAAYEAGDYTTAVDAFRSSYALSSSPALLFNIAQSLRLAGSCEAGSYYEKYRDSGAPLPDDFEDLMRRAKQCEEPKPAPAAPATAATSAPPHDTSAGAPGAVPSAATMPASAPSSASTTAVPPATPSPEESSQRPWLGLACLGVSLGTLAAGTFFTVRATQAESETSELSRTKGATWDAAAQETDRDGRTYAAWAGGLFAVSALTAVAGTVVLIRSSDSSTYRVGVGASSDGVATSVAGHF